MWFCNCYMFIPNSIYMFKPNNESVQFRWQRLDNKFCVIMNQGFRNLIFQIFYITIVLLSLLSCTQSGCKYSDMVQNNCTLHMFWFLVNNLHSLDGTSTAEIIAGDIFFEVVDPVELEYTYRIRPAKDFGAPFVSKSYYNRFYSNYNVVFRMNPFNLKIYHLCL